MVANPVATNARGDLKAAKSALLRLLAPPGPMDPYPDYAVLRRQAPVFLSDFGVGFTTAYEECHQVLTSQDFAVQDIEWFDAKTPGWREHPATLTLYHGLQSRNPPDHTRLRRLLAGAFSPRRMERLRGRVGELTDRCLAAMAEAGGDGGAVDLMETLANPLPIAVIGELLGVPESAREHFSGIARRIFNMMDLFVTDEDRRLADEAATELRDFWTRATADRRNAPRDDLASDLVAAYDAGRIDREELLAILVFLFAAGFGTTAALIGNASVQLLRDPELAAALRADPGTAHAIVEESLRHETPTQIDPRVAVRDTVLGGVPIEAGRFMIAFLGAANRDPARFTDPDRFDIHRPDMRILSFGGGIHFCLGAHLSRMEATVVLPRLFARFPELALAGEPARVPSLRMRHHSRVPVTVR